ncbi:transporter substrate-binding domain-containing protein [Caballeronia mineralivorans]|uniref:transporter substrate-binding and LysM peptidoglycan-binding domain-containing protein n=1 Tax=Caballeronia mineralivorans TaxID=2010198 RepID=UPI0023F0AF4F|nr:transporter substrate-binding domain-containing protein [Caballeronia mineralivorans]
MTVDDEPTKDNLTTYNKVEGRMKLQPGFKKFISLLGIVVVLGSAAYVYRSGVFSSKSSTSFATDSMQSQAGSAQTPVPITQAAQDPNGVANFKPSQDSLQSILQNRRVRISVENPSEPIYGETNGVPHGFNFEFAMLLFAQPEFNKGGPIAIDTHHEVDTYKDVPRQLLVSTNGAPTVDIAMDGLTFPDNSPNGVEYTNPYLDDFGYAMIVQNGSAIKATAELAGKTIGILQGDPDVRAYITRKFPDSKIVEVNDSDPQFISKSLDNHTVDCFVYDYPFAVESIKGTDLKFAITKLDGSNISYKIGVRSADQNLLIYLNSAIGRVKQTPAYLDLLRRYFISAQVATTAAIQGERNYAVRQGDTLNMIAQSQLGSGARYRDIQQRNNLPNPNLILVGQKLIIPGR